MSSNQKSNNPSEWTPAFIAAIAAVNTELSKLSNKEAKELITIVSSTRGLNVRSAYVPIGSIITQAPKRAIAPKGAKQPSKAAWKSDPRWISIEGQHKTLVGRIKSEIDLSVKNGLVSDLRKLEADMKALKHGPLGVSAP